MNSAVIIAIITGLIEMFKKLGLNTKFAPVISVILGLFFCILCGESYSYSDIVINGLIIGLSACGLYSGAKTLIGGNNNESK